MDNEPDPFEPTDNDRYAAVSDGIMAFVPALRGADKITSPMLVVETSMNLLNFAETLRHAGQALQEKLTKGDPKA